MVLTPVTLDPLPGLHSGWPSKSGSWEDVSAWHKKYKIGEQGAPCSGVCSCGSPVPAVTAALWEWGQEHHWWWCLTQQCRKSAAGRSGGSCVRNKYQSHTLWEGRGLGNPGFHCALVMRGCLTCRGMHLCWLEHCARNLGGSSSLPSWWGGEENQPCTSWLLFCAAIAL